MFLLISFAIACILAIVLHGTTRRFVRNRLVSEAAARAASALGRAGELFPLVSRVAALAWAARAGAAVTSLDEVGDWVLLTTPPASR